MKRKAETEGSIVSPAKKQATDSLDIKSRFRPNLFDEASLAKYRGAYAKSEPYKHGVIHNLIENDLLRSVREEIQEHLHFTPKETDIYKIHQSGDLANLDGLEDSALAKLPSLLKLRDALYSQKFRDFISTVADSGPLSGKKTDMAINVYTPGCHLLCHDDVIGSRRLSYILYLPDPDIPWKPEWGGALRLYPTEHMTYTEDGIEAEVPSADFSVVIPPSWNQLSFFTIQPGKSFHDVEEVYARNPRKEPEEEEDGGRVRMAISGWFHIPQHGEPDYQPGLEDKLAERSSLAQLQSNKADRFDLPQPRWRRISIPPLPKEEDDTPVWTEKELDWLLKYINPNYLVPSTMEQLTEQFNEESVVTLSDFLNEKVATDMMKYIVDLEIDKKNKDGKFPYPFGVDEANMDETEKGIIGTARPPHKHRYTFRHSHPIPSTYGAPVTSGKSKGVKIRTPLDSLLDEFLPSQLFARWLSLFTGLSLKRSDVMARRFRKGRDYTLATAYEEDDPMLEVSVGLTPTSGWGGEDSDEDEEESDEEEDDEDEDEDDEKDDTDNVGGFEVYMAGEDDEEDEDQEDNPENDENGASSSAKNGETSHTGAGPRHKTSKSDPAIYRAQDDDEDSGIVFVNPASWNTLSVVLRDKGLLRFVKYVSKSAKGDRWDVVGNWQVEGEAADNDGDDHEENGNENE